MLSYLNSNLNKITMYRLMLYFLLFLLTTTIFISWFNILPYSPVDIFLTGLLLGIVCNLTNYLLSKTVRTRVNFESTSITALILTFIIGPVSFFENIGILTITGLFAIASKYILVVRKRHVFNPAAFGVFASAIVFGSGATWWIGSAYTFPFIALGGFLMLIKIKRFEMALSFLAIYFFMSALNQGLSISSLLSSPLWFFLVVMLVEPLTSPAKKSLQVAFGAIVSFSFFSLQIIFPSFPYGLETSLLIGNIFSLLR